MSNTMSSTWQKTNGSTNCAAATVAAPSRSGIDLSGIFLIVILLALVLVLITWAGG